MISPVSTRFVRNSACSRSPACSSRSTITGIAPSAQQPLTIAAPIPFAPPVTRTTLPFKRRSIILAAQIKKPAVQRIIGAGNESRFVRTQEQRQRSHFLRLPHSSDWLRFCQLFKHLLLSPRIILPQV